MADAAPKPEPLPAPDRHQLERLNSLYDLSTFAPQPGLRGWIGDRLRRSLARLLFKQQEFNAALVDHINRNALVAGEAHNASLHTIAWLENVVAQMVARTEAIAATHNELRTAVNVLQQGAISLRRQVNAERSTLNAELNAKGRTNDERRTTNAEREPSTQFESLASHIYVGFEEQFRGSAEKIRERVAGYVPLFEGTSDVLDIGCGRGEFLAALRERGIGATGIDLNATMVDVCREQGLQATEADALTYLRAQADRSLGGLFAAQVIEHLEPRYLVALLELAFDKLRPGSPIVLETINPACWFAFFSSYIRDITHVRPIHPETLQYLLIASGFQQVEIKYREPYPEHEKLQPIPPLPALGDTVNTLNANAERLNRLLFTWMDYAAVGSRQ